MATEARVLWIAEQEEGNAWLGEGLAAAGLVATFTRVASARELNAALLGQRWALIVISGHRSVLPEFLAAFPAGFDPDGVRPILVAENYDEVAELAPRLGAAVWLRRQGAEHLARAMQRAFTDSARCADLQSARDFERGQRQILEHMASGAGLGELLTEIVQLIEAQATGMMCSILLVDREHGRVRHGAAPSLPRAFVDGIDGSAVGPSAGSCGTAAYLKKRVIVEDIASHPYWAEYRHLALPFGLRACWSSPIFSREGDVLGTFAMYYNEPRAPGERELTWVDRATHLASIAIVGDRAEQALRRSEARYRQIVDTAYEGVWLLDAEAHTLFVNRRTTELLGYSSAEMLGRSLFHFVDGEDRARVEARMGQRQPQTREQLEVHFRRKDGTDLWALVASSTVLSEQGEVVGGLNMITDISQLKRAAEALRQSAAEFRILFENAAIGMALIGAEGYLVRANPALQKMLGYSAEELGRMTLGELTHAEDAESDGAQHQELSREFTSSYQTQKRYSSKDGRVLWGRLTTSAVPQSGETQAVRIAMIEDVTASKLMEDRIGESERLRALVYNAVTDVLFYVGVEPNGEFRFLSVNPAFLKVTGLSEERVVNRLVKQVIPMPSLSEVLANYGRAIREKRTVIWHEETPYPTGTKHGEVSITPLFDASGRCTNLVGTVHDITEHVLAQERIQEQAALLDRARDAIWVRDMEGTIQYWNRGAERLYGWSTHEAIGKGVHDVMPGEASAFEYAQRALLDSGEWSGEFSQLTRAGEPITVDASWTLLRDGRGKPKAVFAIHTDISERRRLELQIARTERMESLGTLASGVAHDFANILSAVTANVGLAQAQIEERQQVLECLSEIERASARGAELVRQILTFSRDRKPERKLVGLQAIVLDALGLLRSSLPPVVQVQTHFAADVPDVFADPTQLNQVVMNLVTNAVHAMGSAGGVLSVGTERVRLPSDANGSDLAPGDYARLTVADTGIGMDPVTAERIFEPFYTTKQAGQGTGLGLSVVHGIVKSHEGRIEVQSTPGSGTVFTIDLPASPARAGGT